MNIEPQKKERRMVKDLIPSKIGIPCSIFEIFGWPEVASGQE